MEALIDRFGGRVLVADGAMGTLLSGSGHSGSALPEEILLEDPDRVRDAHREYAAAGADILVTDTYGAGRLKLSEFGLESRQRDIVDRAVFAARSGASGRNCLVAGSIGPLGSFLAPFGPVRPAEASACFRELAELLVQCGVDLIFLETFTDIRELRLAASAVREAGPRLPILMSMSFERNARTVTGTPAEVLADVSGAFGPGMAGVNCGASLPDNEAAALALLAHSSLPVCYMPNAGIPTVRDGVTTWAATPGDLAGSAVRVCEAGASVAGSCCGSTPEHTRAIAEALSGMPAARTRPRRVCSISSRTSRLVFGGGGFLIAGERINPTGRRALASSIRSGSTGVLRRSAARQAAAGANLLDLNVGVGDPGLEASFMPGAVAALDGVPGLPLFIDSPLPGVVASALPEYPARAFVNSIPCIPSRLEAELPLVKKHGAGFVALLMDAHGVPDTAGGRIALLGEMLAAARAFGLGVEDVIVDPVVLSEAASPGAALVTLETLRRIRSEYGLETIVGLSNVSYGLPARSAVNRAFLTLAVEAGLSAAIMDPLDSDGGLLPSAARLLISPGEGFAGFTGLATGCAPAMEPAPRPDADGPTIEEAIAGGDAASAVEAVERALKDTDPSGLVASVLVPAVTRLGTEYEQGRIFLPMLLAGAEAVEACFGAIRRISGGSACRGTVLMATVEGDVHDIGKNIVAAILAGHGWRIVDLGRNVPAGVIVEAALREKPDAVGLSALLTPSLPVMAAAVALLRERLDPVPPILVGGAVVTEGFARGIGAVYGRDGVQAARILDGGSPS
ncbi:MAG: homocysteine S-methyltransferase family protein [Candidatus Fermentibacter sp.]|nr:homocysteine S-methyltransferase family protein [Candidatus Fermentibacter sp.]